MKQFGTETSPTGFYVDWTLLLFAIGFALFNLFQELQIAFDGPQEQRPMQLPIGDRGIFYDEVGQQLGRLIEKEGSIIKDD